MTLNEFKAWLEGYSEAFKDGMPNADQWAKVQEKLNGVTLIGSYEQHVPSLPKQPMPPYPSIPKVWYSTKPPFVADEINPSLMPKVTCSVDLSS